MPIIVKRLDIVLFKDLKFIPLNNDKNPTVVNFPFVTVTIAKLKIKTLIS